MKITSSANTSIASITPKIVETAYGFLLNTQYYTKEKLSPIPFETLYTYGSPYSLSIRKQLYLQSYTWYFPNEEPRIYKDSVYPNRYYITVLEGYVTGNRRSRIYVIEETENGDIEIIKEYNHGETQVIDFVDQNDNYIYFVSKNNTTAYLHMMDKTTFAVTQLYSTAPSNNYCRIQYLYSNDNNAYFMLYSQQNVYILTLDKVANKTQLSTAIYRGKETTTGTYSLTNLSDDFYKVNEDTYGFYLFNAADVEQPLDLYQYDTTKTVAEGFDMQPVTITWNDEITSFNFLNSGSIYNTVRSFISELNGIKYLHVFMYQMNYDNANYIPYQGIYTFRIESATELTFLGYNQIDGTKQIGGFIYDESKQYLVVAKQNAFQILKFNQTTLKYESTNYEIGSCYSVGLDELQRIWYQKTDSSLHMINMEDAQSVEIEFEKEYYEYAGSTISTYINFSALNYLGEEFTGIFELTISGPAVFTENNNQVLRFTYNTSGKQQVGITITGASPITIYPKFIG